LYEDAPTAVRVYEATDDAPVGVATSVGPDRNGLALFRLAIRGETIRGEWRLIGREFTLPK